MSALGDIRHRWPSRAPRRVWVLCAVAVMAVGMIFIHAGDPQRESGPYKCGSTVMSPGDVCQVMISDRDGIPSDQSDKSYTYDQLVRDREKHNAAKSNPLMFVVGEVLAYAGLLFVVSYGVIYVRDRRRAHRGWRA